MTEKQSQHSFDPSKNAQSQEGGPHHFQSPQDHVSSPQGPTPPLAKNKLWKGILIGAVLLSLCIGLIGGGVWGYGMGTADVIKGEYPELRPLADAGPSKRDQSDQYIDPDEAAFNWNIDDLADLRFNTVQTDANGTPIEDILDKYGKALKGDFSNDEMDLEWGTLQSYDEEEEWPIYYTDQSVSLDFDKKKEAFYLNSLHMYDIRFVGSSHNAEDEAMATDYFEKLKKGDAKTGKDGVSYKDVFKEYGSLQNIYIYVDEDFKEKTSRTIMEAVYAAPNGGSYKLTFIQQEDGNYLLSAALAK
ncbi:hypothetical protein ACVRXQ_08120 [Streptococcus panodentis]|uniref:hypothetical protein n=1 Tax=Streptococcus panodentis TaxID=1581472 RepID=UPI001FDA23FE|nr:hypothetical protein [Streptococcus panodentis]